jgi:hypothetical protein
MTVTVLYEQIYRAYRIMRNEPYHKWLRFFSLSTKLMFTVMLMYGDNHECNWILTRKNKWLCNN